MAVSNPGGEQDYLSGVPVWEFCCARSQELTNLAEELNTAVVKRKGRVSQSLPRHMRRRAASHNLRRLPLRVRERARSQMHPKQLESRVKPKWSLKQNRRKRRYLRNLRLLRMVKQFSDSVQGDRSKCKWLPTHIWHAKRFHMSEQYGWKLPYTPTQKCTRHSYHSVAKNCVSVDTSFLSVFEISSDTSLLTKSLNTILQPSLNLSPLFISMSPLTTTLYHPGYPYMALGPVTLIPLPTPGGVASLWMVAHPSMRSELSQLLEKFPTEVCCKDLTAEIGSIHLLGPSSLHSLLAALPPDLDTLESGAHWFDGFNYKCPQLPSLLHDISNTTNSHLPPNSTLGYTALDPRLSLPHKKLPLLTSPPETSELGDLLLQLQSRLEQDKSDQDTIGVEIAPVLPSPCVEEIESVYLTHRLALSTSQLSNTEHRRLSVANKHSDHVINKHRGRRVSRDDLPFPSDRVPLLLVTTPGCHGAVGSTGAFGAGLLLFLPREWVLSSWVALTYRGVKPVGTKELERVSLERQVPHFPRDHVDTHGYVTHSFEKKRTLEREFLSRPPDKRLNYGKLGVSTPFHCPWGSLVDSAGELMDTETRVSHAISGAEDTSTCAPEHAGIRLPYYVVRERRVVLSLQRELFRTHMPYKYIPKPYRLRYACKKLPPLPDTLSIQRISQDFPNSLLLVSVHMLGRGCVESRAALFLPTQQDIQDVISLYKKGCEDRDVSLFPVGKTNPKGVTRLSADYQVISGVCVQSEEMKTAINVLKRYRKEVRKLSSDPPPGPPSSCCLYKPSDTCLGEMGMAELPADPRHCCGYITSGGYSFCKGYSAGVGCLLTSSLLKLIEVQGKVRLPPIILVRNPSALQLYPAIFTLVDPS